jgi:hypothetical protein
MFTFLKVRCINVLNNLGTTIAISLILMDTTTDQETLRLRLEYVGFHSQPTTDHLLKWKWLLKVNL